MIPTHITVLMVKAGTPLPHDLRDDPLELLDPPGAVKGFLTDCKTIFDTSTKKYVEAEELPDVIESDFLGIISVQTIQSMVSPPSTPFLPEWWDDVGWNDISEDDMFELYETAKRLIIQATEDRPQPEQTYFTVSFIGFWEVETSRDFESQIADVDAVCFAGEGTVYLKP